MRLAETYTAVNKKRIAVFSGIGGYSKRRGMCQLVVLADDKGVKRIPGVQCLVQRIDLRLLRLFFCICNLTRLLYFALRQDLNIVDLIDVFGNRKLEWKSVLLPDVIPHRDQIIVVDH